MKETRKYKVLVNNEEQTFELEWPHSTWIDEMQPLEESDTGAYWYTIKSSNATSCVNNRILDGPANYQTFVKRVSAANDSGNYEITIWSHSDVSINIYASLHINDLVLIFPV